MDIDPRFASVSVNGQSFQVLKPIEYVTVVVGQDDAGEDVTQQVPLPQEWDEEATMALARAAGG